MNKTEFIHWCDTYSKCSEVNIGKDEGHDRINGASNDAPLVMGILNVTPDSFYDGGQYQNIDKAYDHALAMIEAGVDIIDIGGESSRPGAQSISVQEELDRVIPIIERIGASAAIALSIDTCKPKVMQAAIEAGVACINDINALQADGAIEIAAQAKIPVCLMHMQNNPQTMQVNPQYHHVIAEINDFFSERIQVCLGAGIPRSRLILDPGFGFGKTVQHNLNIVNRLERFQNHQLPLLLGMSRKSTLSRLLNQPPEGTLIGGVALAIYAMLVGVSIIRTHDVLETKQAFKTIKEMRQAY